MFQFKFCCLKMSSFSLPFISFSDSLSLLSYYCMGDICQRQDLGKDLGFTVKTQNF